jgi:hypothetical protein
MVVILLVTLPLAFAARRQLAGAQRAVSCTTLKPSGTFPCVARDRATGDLRRGPCEDAQQVLDDELAVGGFFVTPLITVTSTVSPVESSPIPATNSFMSGGRAAYFPERPVSSASDARVAAAWNQVPRPVDGTISPAGARELLAVCATAPPAELEHRTVALMIVRRDDRGAALVLAVGLFVFLLGVARAARVDVDPSTGELRMTESIGPLTIQNLALHMADVVEVTVAQGPKGPFLGMRVELVMREGARIPLVSKYALSSTRTHERAASALRGALGAYRSQRAHASSPV